MHRAQGWSVVLEHDLPTGSCHSLCSTSTVAFHRAMWGRAAWGASKAAFWWSWQIRATCWGGDYLTCWMWQWGGFFFVFLIIEHQMCVCEGVVQCFKVVLVESYWTSSSEVLGTKLSWNVTFVSSEYSGRTWCSPTPPTRCFSDRSSPNIFPSDTVN